MIKINLKDKRYLLGVSGGPDSMALLDICRNKDLYIEVAHVNYHKRASAIDDENLIRKYCEEYHINLHVLDDYFDGKGNFQAHGREVRYQYYADICKQNNLDGVLIAHHQDDLLETYIMQKQKNIGVNYYGLASHIIIKGVDVYRPLLKYNKQDLIDYCMNNNIEYHIDESNLKNDYTRNKIRHEIVDKLSDDDKKQLLKEIIKLNKSKKEELKILKPYLKKDSYIYEEFINIPYLNSYLRLLFPDKSAKYYSEIIRQIKQDDNFKLIKDNKYLVKEYGMVNIFDKPEDYEYVFNNFDEIEYKKYDYFKIVKKGDSFHSATINEDDFPITIRNYRSGDYIVMNYGKKKINRFFIDNKIYLKDRLSYPIVLNKDGSAILVPRIGCDKFHYSHNPNLFMIEL